jgi:hypothetical protein
MIRFPKRLAGMMPPRTHLHTVATDTSNSFATCFVVMYLFMFLNLVAIYTRSDSDASGAASDLVAAGSRLGSASKMFPFRKLFPFVFPFRHYAKSWCFNGFQRCFQCFHIFRRVSKEKLKTTLDLLWADSLKNMETLETFPQALAN